MKLSSALSKGVFILIALIFFVSYTVDQDLTLFNFNPSISGVILSALFVSFGFFAEWFFSKFGLQRVNTVSLGLLCGFLLGSALNLTFSTLTSSLALQLAKIEVDLITVSTYLFSSYLAVSLALAANENIQAIVPFVQFNPKRVKDKKLILDISILSDPRALDLCASGILDRRVIVPDFVVRELNELAESVDEQNKARAKQSLEVLKKLENLAELELRYEGGHQAENTDGSTELVRLARNLDANILTTGISQLQSSNHEGVRIINLNTLSSALKPIMQTGEFLKIKIQRTGKEALQGVGYLEDGTMVVVNGAGDFVGDLVDAKVLSVKHTASGRMVFCNISGEFSELVSKQTSPYTQGKASEGQQEDESRYAKVAATPSSQANPPSQHASRPSQTVKKTGGHPKGNRNPNH